MMCRIVRIFILCFCFSGYIKAQEKAEERYLDVRGISELEMEPLARATANLYEGSNKVKSVQTGLDGTFMFRLEINKQYTIEVAKDGLISKRISFNTQLPDDEKGSWMNEFSIGLMKPCNGVDYSVLNEPVDRVSFDAKRREFVSDKEYVTKMRPKIENLYVKNDQCNLETFESLIKKADQLGSQKNFQEAIAVYREALNILPREEYPAKRISEMNALINKQQYSAEAYKKTIAEADALSSQQKYAEALQKYKIAANLNPQESYARQKVTEIESSLAQQNSARQAQLSAEEKYNQAMAKASVAYTRKDYATAKQYYQEALVLKPAESLPKSRMQEVETIQAQKAAEDAARAAEINKKAAFENDYRALIATADAQYKAKRFDEAKASYTRAITMKPSEAYPAQRVKVIENAVASEQVALQKNREDGYNAAITSANNAIAKKQFSLAKESYQKALTFKPDDVTAKNRLAEVDRLAEDYNKTKSLEEQYTKIIQTADGYLAGKELVKAKESYTQALSLKPGDQYAQSKITAVDNITAAEKAALMKTVNENYNAALSAGNNAVAKNQFSLAKESFQKALTFKPDDVTAKNRLAEVDRLAEDYNKTKSLEEQYNKIIKTADGYLAGKELAKAKESYIQALSLKPGDQYAQSKITAVDNITAAEQAALMKSVNENYDAALSSGNNAVAKNQFELAKESFQKALSFKPNDQYAKNRLVEVGRLSEDFRKRRELDAQYDKLIATADGYFTNKELAKAKDSYLQALSLKPGDQYAQTRITSIDNTNAAEQAAKIKATEEGYKAAIGAANTAITQKTYTQAKEYLQKALTIKPGDVYASGKAAEVNILIQEQQKLVEQEQQLLKQYGEIIASADKSFDARDYSIARSGYSRALQIKPNDSYANRKITSIDDILAAELANKQKQIEDTYKTAMDRGTGALLNKDYKTAKEAFQQALAIKSSDISAKAKLGEVESLIRQEQDNLAAAQARKKKYDEAIKAADQYMAQKSFEQARVSYEQALVMMPAEVYPRQKIDEASKAIADRERLLAEKQASENAYNLSLSNADKYFRAKDYIQARDEYGRALALKPGEAFPKNKQAEMEVLIRNRQKEQDEAKARADAYTAAINAGTIAFNNKDYIAARSSYVEALKQMPGDVLATDQVKKIDYLIAENDKQKKAETEKKAAYETLIASADKSYDAGSYSLAKDSYVKALSFEPNSAYAKQRIARIDEINRALSRAPAKTNTQSSTGSENVNAAAKPLEELNFKNESERQKYLEELKNKYPQGITLEVYKGQYKETYRYIVIRDNQAQEFRQVKFTTYGGAQFSMNGKPITQQYFLTQVKSRQGESFKEISMQ